MSRRPDGLFCLRMICHHLTRFQDTWTSLSACTLTLGEKNKHDALGQTFLDVTMMHVRSTRLIGLYRISRIFLFRSRSRAADTNTCQRVPICSHKVEQVIPRSHDLPVRHLTRNTLPSVRNRCSSSLCTSDPISRVITGEKMKREAKH